MRFVAKRRRQMDARRIESSGDVDGIPIELGAIDYNDAIAICRRSGLVYCHAITPDPPPTNGHDRKGHGHED